MKDVGPASWVGAILILLGTLGFSSKAILVKVIYEKMPDMAAISLMSLRMMMALPVFAVVAWLMHRRNSTHISLKTNMGFMFLGAWGYYLAGFLDFSGLQLIPASLERLILFLYPTLVVVFSAVAYKQKITMKQAVALVISYAGIAIVFIEQLSAGHSEHIKGSVLIALSAAVFAIYVMVSGQKIRKVGSHHFTAWAMTGAALATLFHFVITQPISQLSVDNDVLGITAIMALFATILPAFLINAGIQRIGASMAAIIGTAGPVFTLIMAWLFLGENLSSIQLLGMTVIILGALLPVLEKQKKP